MTPRITAAMKKPVALETQPSIVRFGPASCRGGASERSSGSFPIGSTLIGSRLMAVFLPGVGSVIVVTSSLHQIVRAE